MVLKKSNTMYSEMASKPTQLPSKSMMDEKMAECENIGKLERKPLRASTMSLSDEPTTRGSVVRLLEASYFDSMMGCLIFANVMVMVSETNTKAGCIEEEMGSCTETWVDVANVVFQLIYTVELALRLFAYRLEFFKNRWNLLDVAVVLMGYIDYAVVLAAEGAGSHAAGRPNIAMLRIFRILRLMRVARIISFFPELHVMVMGFFGAMMAMFWGMVMIVVLILIWSIVAVEIINPVNRRIDHEDEWCVEGFSTVQSSMLMLIQTIFAGDSWGVCAVPIIRTAWFTAFIFLGALITIQLGFTNLVLAVIVERAANTREVDLEAKTKALKKAKQESTERIRTILQEIDQDDSGLLTFEELMIGFDENAELRHTLSNLDIGKPELGAMFQLLTEGEGVEYEDFVEHLQNLECMPIQLQVTMTSLWVRWIATRILEDQEQRTTRTPPVTNKKALRNIFAQSSTVFSLQKAVDQKKMQEAGDQAAEDGDAAAAAEGGKLEAGGAKAQMKKQAARAVKEAKDATANGSSVSLRSIDQKFEDLEARLRGVIQEQTQAQMEAVSRNTDLLAKLLSLSTVSSDLVGPGDPVSKAGGMVAGGAAQEAASPAKAALPGAPGDPAAVAVASTVSNQVSRTSTVKDKKKKKSVGPPA